MRKNSLKQLIISEINNGTQEVFFRKDFAHIGSYNSIGRVLNQLIDDGKLIKVSNGIYAKAEENFLTGKPMFSHSHGFMGVCIDILNRLDVKWSYAIVNDENCKHVPANACFIIHQSFSRKISTDRFEMKYTILRKKVSNR